MRLILPISPKERKNGGLYAPHIPLNVPRRCIPGMPPMLPRGVYQACLPCYPEVYPRCIPYCTPWYTLGGVYIPYCTPWYVHPVVYAPYCTPLGTLPAHTVSGVLPGTPSPPCRGAREEALGSVLGIVMRESCWEESLSPKV